MSVTFETKVWENDWELVLNTPRLGEMVERCRYAFSRRVLFINNVSRVAPVEAAARKWIRRGVLDEVVIVEEHADEALEFLGLSREKLGRGLYYSVAELVSIHLARTNYLLHFSGDSMPADSARSDWMEKGLAVLQSKPGVKVFNLVWNHAYQEASREAEDEDQDCYYGYGFSDQMYLIRVADFRSRIYEHRCTESARYPEYGGELFEKRVDGWMRTGGFRRATYKHASYVHRNYSKSRLARKLAVWMNRPYLFQER
jgi:hypothetical protein